VIGATVDQIFKMCQMGYFFLPNIIINILILLKILKKLKIKKENFKNLIIKLKG